MFNTQRIASKRNAPQGKANRAAHHGGLLDVFSHQTRRIAGQGQASQGSAKQRSVPRRSSSQSKSGSPSPWVSRCVFTSNAGHGKALRRNASQSSAAHCKANRAGHWQQWFSRCVFTSHARHSSARQRKAPHRKAPRPGHSQECFRQVVLTHSAWATPAI